MATATAKGGSSGINLNTVLFYVFLLLFVLVSLFPLLWVFKMSIVTKSDLFQSPTTTLIAPPISDNYQTIFSNPDFRRALVNSTVIAGITTIICLFFGAICAYAIARLRFRFKSAVMTTILAISFFPAVAIIAPLFVFFSNFGRDHHGHGVRPAADDLDPGGVLQGTPEGSGRGG
jgi:multiple sugar transport system permease protein